MSQFELYIPPNLSFQDYLAIVQTARAWADGYDLKSLPHLSSTIAPTVSVDYTSVNPALGMKHYNGPDFAKLWMSSEHLGNRALATQHLLGQPYFSYVGPRINDEATVAASSTAPNGGEAMMEVEEIHVSWQLIASHARRLPLSSSVSSSSEKGETEYHPAEIETETSDHRSFVHHKFIKISSTSNAKGGEEQRPRWKISSIKPVVIYGPGDWGRVTRGEGEP